MINDITIPTVEEINDMYDAYIKDLEIRDLHLKLITVFSTNELDDLLSLLKQPYVIDLSPVDKKTILPTP